MRKKSKVSPNMVKIYIFGLQKGDLDPFASKLLNYIPINDHIIM